MDRNKRQSMIRIHRQFMETCLLSDGSGALHKLFDENIFGFGTAIDEKIFGIKEVKKLLNSQQKQSKGLDIKWKIKPASRFITADENTAIFADDLRLSIRAGKETVKMYVRFSVVLNFNNDQWKVIHWHGSKPEQVESEKDTWGVENWKQKATELERLVDEKTADLVGKNRELEIEASLERVRAVTMGMNKPNDILNICQVFFKELQSLGFKNLRNTLINFWDDENGQLHDYDYSDFAGGNFAKLAYNSHPAFSAFQKKIRKAKDAFAKLVINKEGLKSWQQRRRSSGEYKDPRLNKISALYYYFYSTGVGALGISTFSPISKDEVEVLKRFRNVFDMAYQRYADIQKAAAQAREAEIELALERVRARTMAMQKSDELYDVAHLLHEQFKSLGEITIQMTIGIANKAEKLFDTSVTDWSGQGKAVFRKYKMSFAEPALIKHFYNAWKKNEHSVVIELRGERLKKWVAYRNKLSGVKIKADKPRIITAAFFSKGFIAFSKHEASNAATVQLLERFAVVFNQTYTRFLDLQKAEAQAREAQIEAALEKVRSRSMAMQQPEELIEVAELLRREMGLLGVEELETSSIYIIDHDKKKAECWYAIKDVRKENAQLISDEMTLTLTDTWVGKEMWKFYQSANDRVSILMKGERRRAWINYCAEHSKVLKGYYGDEIPERTYHLVKFNGGYMGAASPGDISRESWELLKRAAVVFSLAYTRFKDLQDAAARAREAQIELALERVRSRSMAMHKSEELKEVIKVVLEQFVHLHINAEHAGFYIDYKTHDDMHIWLADPNIEPFYAVIPYFDTPTWNSFLEAKTKGTTLHTDLLDFKAKNKFYKSLFKLFTVPEEAKQFYMQCKGLAVSTVLLDSVGLYIENFSAIPYTDEENNILIRFGKVFQQSYTRFLDLQKAEAQAREAQIEAALERVRSKTMAMHKSDELIQTAELLFDQLKQLGAELQGVAFAICDKNSLMVQKWTSIGIFSHPYNIEPGEERMYNAWKNQSGLYEEIYEGERQKKYYEAFMEIPEFKKGLQQFTDSGYPFPTWQKNHAVPFKHGYLLFITTRPFDETQIFVRFGKVFEQTYTRFLDLQKAEAQAREAQIEAALEKVRSRTLAMQKSAELAEAAAEVFRQLIGLGIEPNRLYIGIVNGDTKDMEMWATDEDGSGVGKKFTFNAGDNSSVKKLYDGWVSRIKSVTVDMQGAELEDYIHYLKQLNIPLSHALTQKRRVQSVAYFDKGFIGMASPDEQSEKNILLLERFAAVFNLTFTRFNDLKIAEAHAQQAEQDLIAIKEAKQKAEEALTELQATQKQLIQSEKMASLGELTAGIAHEIQNPLNFVNNFSDVSTELVNEMNEEIDKGNLDDAKQIAQDLKQNLEKINHHGKRAGDIVKGMLQHSRTSSGQKELTDINALTDEYLRLAYHGLRAKDKTFNAAMKTDYDKSIGLIKIIPQDIGRVALNLITNAFYAVTQRTKLAVEGYEPIVTITTKKLTDSVEVQVKDNGTGIPQKALDKIFQPFFTTKPTGQGTGLGLSLSYDIVKAHGGEIRVETKEGEGTTFIISIPS